MFKSIVVGVDGPPTAQEALRRAAGLAETTGAELHVVCAYQGASIIAVDPIGVAALGAGGTEALKEAADDVLRSATRSAGDRGVTIQTHAVEGEASDALIDVAEGMNCDLIVVGSRGMRGGKRLLLGSVPNRVAHHAGRDVLIVYTA